MTIPSKPDLLDFYAGHAMNALIAKIPTFVSGPEGVKPPPGAILITEKMAEELRSKVAEVSFKYASAMLEEKDRIANVEATVRKDDFQTVKDCLSEAAADGMQVEVVLWALDEMRGNPKQSIASAMSTALHEWVK